jgi:hypothetical protein
MASAADVFASLYDSEVPALFDGQHAVADKALRRRTHRNIVLTNGD